MANSIQSGLIAFELIALELIAFGWISLATPACAKKVEPSTVAESPANLAESSRSGNQRITSFDSSKKVVKSLSDIDVMTIYCPCKVTGRFVDLKSCQYRIHKDEKRAARLEWEHVVPAEAFGQSFSEWREGAASCHSKSGRRFRGRKCAEKNREFRRMEADLYNLWPIVGELNGLRSNYSMAEISGRALSFGGCRAKIADRKFEPMDEYKGLVARVYLYMDRAYPGRGIISRKNRPLFDAWNKMHPVTAYECNRGKRVKSLQGNENPILTQACEKRDSVRPVLKQSSNL